MQEEISGSSIRNLVEIDKKARERVAEARRQSEEISSDAENKKKQLLSDYSEQAKIRLRDMEVSYRSEADKTIADLEKEKQSKMRAFDKSLSQNREKLANQVFEAVTGRKRRK